MGIEALHPHELPLLYWIRSLEFSRIDQLAIIWNTFDTDIFSFFVIPLVWMVWGRRAGVWVLCALIVNATANLLLKQLFQLPRPIYYDPALGLITLGDYGFPSGGAQSAVVLPGLLIYFWRTKLSWIVGILFGISLALSRLWLGVHFPTDVLGGLVAGSGVLAAIVYSFPYLEKKSFSPIAYQIPGIVLLALHLYFGKNDLLLYSGVFFGALNGILIFKQELIPNIFIRYALAFTLFATVLFLFSYTALPLFLSAWLAGSLLPLPYHKLFIKPTPENNVIN